MGRGEMAPETQRTDRRFPEWLRRTLKGSQRHRPDATQAGPPPARTVATAIAKWLIPSLSALFIAVGFAVESAYQDMIGIERPGVGTSDYIAASSKFLRDLLTMVPDLTLGAFTWGKLPHFDGPQIGLMATLLLVCIGMTAVGTRPFLASGGAKQWLIALLLLVLTLWKFLLLDAPIARISNVLVSVGGESGGATNSLSLENKLETEIARGGLNGFVAKRALFLWTNMVCSRISRDALRSDEREPRVKCIHEDQASAKRVQSEFIAHSIASILLLTLAIQGLRRVIAPWVAAVALVVAGYVLTWPYAYGKLVKSTYYEYGFVWFKSSIAEPATATSSSAELIKDAIILFRDSTSSKLLVVKDGKRDCPGGANSQAVRLWEVSNSDILAVKEIYREDVIAWKTLHERTCPPVQRRVL